MRKDLYSEEDICMGQLYVELQGSARPRILIRMKRLFVCRYYFLYTRRSESFFLNSQRCLV